MDRLLKRIHRVRPAAFCSRNVFFLHDNAPTHKAASVCQFLAPKNVTTFYHHLYSPDLSPPDCFLFCNLKMKLKRLHFSVVTEIQQAVTDELKKVLKEEFSAVFQKLYDRAKARIYANGAYFEWKKYVSSSCVFGFFFKISVLKLLEALYIAIVINNREIVWRQHSSERCWKVISST